MRLLGWKQKHSSGVMLIDHASHQTRFLETTHRTAEVARNELRGLGGGAGRCARVTVNVTHDRTLQRCSRPSFGLFRRFDVTTNCQD